MKVYFIGAGPGAFDLITIRGANILSGVGGVMYGGWVVSEEMLRHCQANPLIVNTAKLNLEEQERYYRMAQEQNWDVARLHSGDPSIYGATAEQMRRLEQLGIAYEVVPGVPSFVSAAAVLNAELTKPNISQTIVLTRTSGRASPMPAKEDLRSLAAHGATLCLFLSGANLPDVIDNLLVHYPADTPIALVHTATCPEERVHRVHLPELLGEIEPCPCHLTTILLLRHPLNTPTTPQAHHHPPAHPPP